MPPHNPAVRVAPSVSGRGRGRGVSREEQTAVGAGKVWGKVPIHSGEGSRPHFLPGSHLWLPGDPELDGTTLGVQGEAGGRGIWKALGL